MSAPPAGAPPGRPVRDRAVPPAGGRREERFRREADALRANLRRRKEQARRRAPAAGAGRDGRDP